MVYSVTILMGVLERENSITQEDFFQLGCYYTARSIVTDMDECGIVARVYMPDSGLSEVIDRKLSFMCNVTRLSSPVRKRELGNDASYHHREG